MGDTSFDLEPGKTTTINNPNPANMRFRVETRGGTWISFPIPAGGSFEIHVGNDIARAELHIDDVPGYGPRSVD